MAGFDITPSAVLVALVQAVLLTGVASLANYLYQGLIRPRWYSRHIPGPKWEGFFGGHMGSVLKTIPIPWHEEYGSVIKIDGPVGTIQLSIDDKKALHHILVAESYRFPKPDLVRNLIAITLDQGLIVAEGDVHRRQRKIMNPSFGVPHMKAMYPVFFEKAQNLRDSVANKAAAATLSTGKPQVNMFRSIGQATLDVMAATGFAYETNALEVDDNELAVAFGELFGVQAKPSLGDALAAMFPRFKAFIPIDKEHKARKDRAMETMTRVGVKLVNDKKKAVLSDGVLDPDQISGKDVLSTLIRANMAEDLKKEQKLSDREVLAQISTVLVAANDTTLNALSWALYAITRDTAIQDKLREEARSANEVPTYDELNSLPYLDAVIRETLRIWTPVPGTHRIATEDSVVPLSQPFVDVNGKKHEQLFIPKNTAIYIPMLAINTSTKVWGPTAKEFRPERWLEEKASLPEGVMELPSVAFPTFLAGPRSCIGFRFSLLELKTMLFAMIRDLEFKLAVSDQEIEKKMTDFTSRPTVKDRPEGGYQMPMYVSVL